MTDSFEPLMASGRSKRVFRVTRVWKNTSSVLTNTSKRIRPKPRFPMPPAAVAGSLTVPPKTGVLNRLDHHLGIGYEFDSEGHLCRRDVINRLYRVDEYGKRITNRTTTCPPHLDSETWWRVFTPKDRIAWYTDMRAREAAEAKLREENVPSSVDLDAVDRQATPAPSVVIDERRENSSRKVRRLGIAGLFSDENETRIHNESDSEASTSGAAPASVVESEEDDVPPWEHLDNELEIENSICAAAREAPQKRDDEIPAMPCVANYKGEPHRPKIVPFNSHSWTVLRACVARPVSRKEVLESPPARAAMKAEWDRLRNKMVWDEDKVREWSDVAREAQRGNVELNFGYLFGICVEKNSELPPLHPKRKFKGRVVFQGNRVTNQNWEAAIFQDMGSSPSTMEASKAADFYGLIPGHAVEIADAVQAYIQAELSGTPCWICLPPEARPKSWDRFKKPVVPLLRALYGHPDSGTMWEVHCDTHVQSVGFKLVGEEWQSCYFHPTLKLYLVVYVDDFKLSGPKENLSQGWSLIRKGLDIEPPVPIGVYLGCSHEEGTMKVGNIVARTMTYNMEDFLSSCVDRYLELAGNGVKLKAASTPFINEDQGTSPQGAPCESGPFCECPWCKNTFPANVHKPAKDVSWDFNKGKAMANVCQNATHQLGDGKQYNLSELVEMEHDRAENGAYHATPAQDRKDLGGTPPPAPDQGRLQPIAAKVLMKILYAARLCRFDLLRAVCHLATFVTKWTSECDRKLHRLVCYINSSKHLRMIGWVGDDLSALQPHLFADADFAGCTATQRSTSGYHFAIRGPNTCFPITGVSRRQTCVSHSTPEAEIVSADLALRHCGLPSFALWWTLLPQKPKLVFHEDNQTMIRVIETGRNPTMRYLARTHRVSVAWLHETFSQQSITLMYEVSSRMCADIYTKAFTDATKWQAVCDLINIVDPKRLQQFVLDYSSEISKDESVDCHAKAASMPSAMSSPFAPDPVRYDNTAHEDWPRHPPGKALGRTLDFDRTNRLMTESAQTIQRGGITKILSPLSGDHLKVMKTCVDCIQHGTRIGRSWGAGLKYDEYHVGSGGPTQAEFNMKPAVDVTGNLTITKTANAVTVINTFVAQYVGDLEMGLYSHRKRVQDFSLGSQRMGI